MQLTLKVLSYCDQHVSESQIRTFDTFPIVIGRSDTCNYRLEDPSQYVSSNHAVILIEDDKLFIRDTSSNGVYINGITEPIGRQRSVALNDNDTLAIGDYMLSVRTTNSHASAAENPLSKQDNHSKSSAQQALLDNNELDIVHLATNEMNPDVDLGNSDADAPKPSNLMPKDKQPDLASTFLALKQQKVSAGNHKSVLNKPNNQVGILLRAASLDDSDFSHLNESVVLENSGRMLAQMVDAMMVLLSSCTEIKEYIQSDNTTPSPNNNNPLKFSASSTDALSTLLSNDNPGYVPSDEAIKESVDDLKLHQLALLEGMKLAIRSLLLKLDPNKLAQKIESNEPLGNNVPVTHKAKLWELFCEQYDEIREEATNDFQALLGTEFRKYYEQQTKTKRQDSKIQEPDF